MNLEVFRPMGEEEIRQTIVDTRWVPTREVIEGNASEKARLVEKGFKDPDLHQGLVETAGCVSLRSSHLQLLSLCA